VQDVHHPRRRSKEQHHDAAYERNGNNLAGSSIFSPPAYPISCSPGREGSPPLKPQWLPTQGTPPRWPLSPRDSG
jgi:hypothetical protein